MKIDYDPTRDLLYIWFGQERTKAAQTETVAPGVHADLDAKRKLVGLEALDASDSEEAETWIPAPVD